MHKEYIAKGFCSSYGEQHQDFHAIGVPLGRSADGETIVFNCVAQTHLFTRDKVETTLGPKLAEMVEHLRTGSGVA